MSLRESYYRSTQFTRSQNQLAQNATGSADYQFDPNAPPRSWKRQKVNIKVAKTESEADYMPGQEQREDSEDKIHAPTIPAAPGAQKVLGFQVYRWMQINVGEDHRNTVDYLANPFPLSEDVEMADATGPYAEMARKTDPSKVDTDGTRTKTETTDDADINQYAKEAMEADAIKQGDGDATNTVQPPIRAEAPIEKDLAPGAVHERASPSEAAAQVSQGLRSAEDSQRRLSENPRDIGGGGGGVSGTGVAGATEAMNTHVGANSGATDLIEESKEDAHLDAVGEAGRAPVEPGGENMDTRTGQESPVPGQAAL